MQSRTCEPSIRQACRLLFGDGEIDGSLFLDRPDPDLVKRAFRKKAMVMHPDRLAGMNEEARSAATVAFVTIHRAYEELLDYASGQAGSSCNTAGSSGPAGSARTTGTGSTRSAHHSAGTEAGRARNGAGSDNAYGEPAGAHGGRRGWSGFFRGSIPPFELRIGEYLYYRGIISWHELIQAIVWQRKQRPRFGEIASSWNLLEDGDVRTILSRKRLDERVGEAALRLGLLPEAYVETILKYQSRRQRPIGTYFTERDLVKRDELTRFLCALELHNRNVR